MKKSRTGRKLLSLLLTLCMIVSLLAGLTSAASAAGSTRIHISSGGAVGPAGGGWNWDAAKKTLTLSGVDIETSDDTEPVYIDGTVCTSSETVTLVLEGANRLVNSTSTGTNCDALCSNRALTIKGSGTLEAASTAGDGIDVGRLLTIESGYITVNGGLRGIYASSGMTVTGGYVDATGTGSNAGHGIHVGSGIYAQSGGYVKTASTNDSGLKSTAVSVSGGYLETSGKNGIVCDNFSNGGGVVKATGSAENGISAAATFSGGVSIVKGATAAFSAVPACTLPEAIKYGAYNDAGTEVIIAKARYTQALPISALDGVYIKYTGSEPAITTNSTLTVNGGSYIEAADNYAIDASNYNAAINGTLVCLNTATNKSALSVDYSKTITIAAQGTLYCNGSGSMGLSNPGIIYNSGQLITEGGKAGVAAATINCNDGYIFGLGASELYGGITASTRLNAIKGYITGIGNSNGIGVSSNGITAFTDNNYETKAMTAICASNKSYSGKTIAGTGVVVTGTATKYDPLEPVTYNTSDETYKAGNSKAMVVCAKVTSTPSAAISGSAIEANTGMAFTGDVTVTLTNAKFAAIDKDVDVSAWFTFPEGWADKSAKIKTAVVANATSATVTIGGKINNEGSVSLTGGSVPTTAFAEAPAAAVTPTGSVTVNISEYTGTLYLKAGVLYTNSTCTIPYTGQTDKWSTVGGELYLNGFEYASTAETALDIVGDDTTIHISGTNSFATEKMVAINRDKSGMLSIVGSGTLNATTTGSTSGNRYGFYNQGGLTVGSGVTLNCVGGNSTGGNSDGLVVGGSGLTTSFIIEAGAAVYARAGTAKDDPNKYSCGSRLFEKSATINGSFYTTGITYAIFTAQGFSLNPGEGVMAKASAAYEDADPAAVYANASIATYKTVKTYVPSAKVADVTVTGYTGEAITGTDVVITLEGYKFASPIGANTVVDTWFAAGNLPAGLTAKIKTDVAADATSATIAISGISTEISSAAMSITIPKASLGEADNVTVAANPNAKFNITAALTITTTALGGGTVGSAYRTILQATGDAPITWSVTAGTLPAGLSIDGTTGIISGTPTAAEAKTFTVKAENSAGSDTRELSITISAAPSHDRSEYPVIDESVKGAGGTVSISRYTAPAGTDVAITPRADSGFAVDTVTVKDAAGNRIKVAKNASGVYIFTMPTGKVTVTVTFARAAMPFADVTAKDWFYEDVLFNLEKGLMQGTSAGAFSPYVPTTRGMIVTILYRLEGSPAVTGACPFKDVKSGSYCESAIIWAASHKIVEGYSAVKFGPDDAMTREQLAAVLYRYEQYKGGGFTGSWMFLLDAPDAESVSDWAYEAMCWCSMKGIISGDEGGLLTPQKSAQRCQAAAILHRFCELER